MKYVEVSTLRRLDKLIGYFDDNFSFYLRRVFQFLFFLFFFLVQFIYVGFDKFYIPHRQSWK